MRSPSPAKLIAFSLILNARAIVHQAEAVIEATTSP
jgi:hypothetical protein